MDTLPRDNSDSLNFQVGQSKLPYILQKFHFVIIRAGQILKLHHQNCPIFAKFAVRDIEAGQIIKSHPQNCFILGGKVYFVIVGAVRIVK